MSIFLGGGGNEHDSRLLDEAFAQSLDRAKPLLYIPNASRPEKFDASWQWMKRVADSLGIKNVQMWEKLEPVKVKQIGGIYIGGGSVERLMGELHTSGFAETIRLIAKAGVSIYGGSAGAIALGRFYGLNPMESPKEGLNLLGGVSVVCHFNPETDAPRDELRAASRKYASPFLAIPEKAGVVFNSKMFFSVGTEDVWLYKTKFIKLRSLI